MERETYPDATVVALSRKFHWVEIDRDAQPELVKRFHVSAYPSLLTLGKKEEKVHRFQGFKKPEPFEAELREALRRYDLYTSGKEWDEPPPRPPTICSAGTVQSFPAPAEGVPSGITALGGRYWIAQKAKLYAVDPATGGTTATFDLPQAVRDLCTDGELLYGMEYGWTAGKPIHVLDPATGKVLRTIVTRANLQNKSYGAAGITWKDGKLYVLEGMRGILNEVDPQTGAITRKLDCEVRWLSGLGYDGKHFVAGSRQALYLFDAKTGKQVRKVALNYPVRAVAAHDGAYLLMEQPVFGHDKQHKRVQLWPKQTLVYSLQLETER